MATTLESSVTVRFLTLAEAAERVGVSERTIRSWVEREQLRPVPLSKEFAGEWLFEETKLTKAEKLNRHGRSRRREKPEDCVTLSNMTS